MSYSVCHLSKFTKGTIKGVEIHNQREKDKSHTNPDIDWTRTKLNYDLHNQKQISFTRAVNERINKLNLTRAVRKDAIVMAGFIVSSDKLFFDFMSEQQQKQFFEDSYNFLAERYGKENVVSAIVHNDEKTPHMHFEFVPVTADGRLSAKALLTKTELQRLHTAYYESVGQRYGLARGIEGSKAEHVDTARYKAHIATCEAKHKKEYLESLSTENEPVSVLKEHKSLFSSEPHSVTISAEDFQALLTSRKLNKGLKAELEETTRKLTREYDENLYLTSSMQYKTVRKIAMERKQEKETAVKYVNCLENKISELEETISNLKSELSEEKSNLLWAEQVIFSDRNLTEKYERKNVQIFNPKSKGMIR